MHALLYAFGHQNGDVVGAVWIKIIQHMNYSGIVQSNFMCSAYIMNNAKKRGV